MNKRRRRIQKGRRREEKLVARVARWQKMLASRPGARAWRPVVTQEEVHTFANAPNAVSIGHLVARGDGPRNVVLADPSDAREVVGVVIDVLSTTECLVADTLTPFQRGIVERLRGAGQVVIEVESRHASTIWLLHGAFRAAETADRQSSDAVFVGGRFVDGQPFTTVLDGENAKAYREFCALHAGRTSLVVGRPCDHDASDDTKGALNVHNAATGDPR